MFENKASRCSIERPVDMRTSEPLYLTAIDKPTTEIWYEKCPIGVNTNNLMQIRKKFTNHSARKTLVKKLKSNNVPKSNIIAITGHTTEAG